MHPHVLIELMLPIKRAAAFRTRIPLRVVGSFDVLFETLPVIGRGEFRMATKFYPDKTCSLTVNRKSADSSYRRESFRELPSDEISFAAGMGTPCGKCCTAMAYCRGYGCSDSSAATGSSSTHPRSPFRTCTVEHLGVRWEIYNT